MSIMCSQRSFDNSAMSELPPVRAVSAFQAVARHGSFSKAAEELGLTPSAVSHQIANLERYVGRPLFQRTSHGVSMTPAGERFHRNLAGALLLISSAAASAREEGGIEVLSIHSYPSFASMWLMPRLRAFMTAHKAIRLRLSAAPVPSDFSRGEVDLDIRYGTVHWPDLHVETLCSEEIIPMISPKLVKHLPLQQPEDLLSQNLIISEAGMVQWPHWFAAYGIPITPSEYALRFDRGYMVLDAAVQGLGIALESKLLAEGLIKQGALVPVFPHEKGIRVHAHHLVYPPAHAKRAKVARFISWLRKEMAKYPR